MYCILVLILTFTFCCFVEHGIQHPEGAVPQCGEPEDLSK